MSEKMTQKLASASSALMKITMTTKAITLSKCHREQQHPRGHRSFIEFLDGQKSCLKGKSRVTFARMSSRVNEASLIQEKHRLWNRAEQESFSFQQALPRQVSFIIKILKNIMYLTSHTCS